MHRTNSIILLEEYHRNRRARKKKTNNGPFLKIQIAHRSIITQNRANHKLRDIDVTTERQNI